MTSQPPEDAPDPGDVRLRVDYHYGDARIVKEVFEWPGGWYYADALSVGDRGPIEDLSEEVIRGGEA